MNRNFYIRKPEFYISDDLFDYVFFINLIKSDDLNQFSHPFNPRQGIKLDISQYVKIVSKHLVLVDRIEDFAFIIHKINSHIKFFTSMKQTPENLHKLYHLFASICAKNINLISDGEQKGSVKLAPENLSFIGEYLTSIVGRPYIKAMTKLDRTKRHQFIADYKENEIIFMGGGSNDCHLQVRRVFDLMIKSLLNFDSSQGEVSESGLATLFLTYLGIDNDANGQQALKKYLGQERDAFFVEGNVQKLKESLANLKDELKALENNIAENKEEAILNKLKSDINLFQIRGNMTVLAQRSERLQRLGWSQFWIPKSFSSQEDSKGKKILKKIYRHKIEFEMAVGIEDQEAAITSKEDLLEALRSYSQFIGPKDLNLEKTIALVESLPNSNQTVVYDDLKPILTADDPYLAEWVKQSTPELQNSYLALRQLMINVQHFIKMPECHP